MGYRVANRAVARNRIPGRPGIRGQGLVEFTLAIPFVLLLLAGIFEFGHHYYTRMTMRHAVAEAARFSVTGLQLTNPQTGVPLTRAQSVVQMIHRRAGDLSVQVVSINLIPPSGGAPGEVVTIGAELRYFLVFPSITRLFSQAYIDFTVATTVKNEPVF